MARHESIVYLYGDSLKYFSLKAKPLSGDIMSQKEISILTNYTDTRASEYIYYNVLYTNDTGGVAPILVNDRRSSVLIDDGLRYRYVGAVKRFLIDSFLIPLTYISDPSKFVITIELNGGGLVSQQFVFVASSNSQQASIVNGVFSVEQWVAGLNATILGAYTGAIGLGLPATFPPFFTFNGSSISLVTDSANYFPSNPLGAKIYVSNAIFTRLGGNTNYLYTINNSPRDALLLVKSLGNNVYPVNTFYDTADPPVLIAFESIVMPSSDSALVSLTTINQILIQAIATEIRPQFYGSNLVIDTPANLSLQTLEDFIYVPNGRGKILYQPSIERPFNMMSDKPITQFSFNVLYMDSDLQTYQVLCIPGSTSSFKFGFTKDYNENDTSVLLTIYRLLEKFGKKFGVF